MTLQEMMALFLDPDIVCEGEYRAIYDYLSDFEDDNHAAELAVSSLENFIESARYFIGCIQEAYEPS